MTPVENYGEGRVGHVRSKDMRRIKKQGRVGLLGLLVEQERVGGGVVRRGP